MQRKAFVLLSGGLDSTVALHKAIQDFAPDHEGDWLEVMKEQARINWVEAISIEYGQRHRKEIDYAARTCARLGVVHRVLSLAGLVDLAGVMLTDPSQKIPNAFYADLPAGMSPAYVPFRNGMMLSACAAVAVQWVSAKRKLIDDYETKNEITLGVIPTYEAAIYFGAHAEDAQRWAYADCTPEFVGAMANAIHTGTYNSVRLVTPFQYMTKGEIVRLGGKLGVRWEDTWSCYAGFDKHCGTCPTCRARYRAFSAALLHDPTEYAE